MQEPKPEFKFEIPQTRPEISEITNTVLQLGALAGRLALEERTLVNHIDGRPENVAEHIHMLSRIAPILAIEYYSYLDPGMVSMYATISDDIEAYVGDTPTHKLDKMIQKTKDELEKTGLAQLIHEYAHIPSYVQLVKDYEDQRIPETRFVRVVDKLMPLTVHFNQGGVALRSYETKSRLTQYGSARVKSLIDQYPEFIELINVRHELKLLAANELFE